MTDETIMGVVPAKMKKGFFAGSESYNLVFTDKRMIMAIMTKEMINAIDQEVKAADKDAKGITGAIAVKLHQKAAELKFFERYYTIPPDKALGENPQNKEIGNTAVSSVKIKVLKNDDDDTVGSSDLAGFLFGLESQVGNYNFTVPYNEGFPKFLQNIYGENKVHLPFGYKYGIR